jgi:hypothetical protein
LLAAILLAAEERSGVRPRRPASVCRLAMGDGAFRSPAGRQQPPVQVRMRGSTGSNERRRFPVQRTSASAFRMYRPAAIAAAGLARRPLHSDMFLSFVSTLHPALCVPPAPGSAGGRVGPGRGRAPAPSFSRPGRTPTRAPQFRSHCSRVKSCSRSGWHTDRRRAAQRRPQPAVRYGSSDDAPGPFSVRAGSSLRIGRSLASPPPVSPPGGSGPAASARPLLFRSGRTAAAPEPPRRVSLGACTPRTDPYVQRNCR